MLSMTRWRLAVAGSVISLVGVSAVQIGSDSQKPAPTLPAIELTEAAAFPLPAHLESADIASGRMDFEKIFDAGSLLFHAEFNGLDGVGSFMREDGTTLNRFAPMGPRGPAAQSCAECHNRPPGGFAGLAHSGISTDPAKKGVPPFNVRSVTSIMGNGILQLLAQEMTEELQATRDAAVAAAKASPGTVITRELKSKGTAFGSISATATSSGDITFDVSRVEGIDPDLVVRPLGWKGDTPNLRLFSAGASAAAMGLIAEELIWKKAPGQNPDVDGDGVTRELSVGDITALTIYQAAQETPAEFAHLATLGYVRPPTPAQTAQIAAGRKAIAAIGCTSCHTPEMTLVNTRFEEPTLRGNGNYYNRVLAGQDPNFDPKRPAWFDILKQAQPPRAEARTGGGATIRLYGDLKRHAMGRVLADPASETESPATPDAEDLMYDGTVVKIPADVFLTAELWGVGNTGPWLHDNRAGTLREAILLHGEDTPPPLGSPGRSEAQAARDGFKALSPSDQEAVVAFLKSLVTFSPEGNGRGSQAP
ncbi:MAG TPA: di-heme oxidoredictase family protein [Vicinamibacterales bacterium]|nr:di-heme oxidoredictase family protein [Vicinamibacterales bacterium]